MELPPRARRILELPAVVLKPAGTTSACAENTQQEVFRAAGDRNYLRVRGEYLMLAVRVVPSMELPPRARRIPRIINESNGVLGTTSACAENTLNELGLL